MRTSTLGSEDNARELESARFLKRSWQRVQVSWLQTRLDREGYLRERLSCCQVLVR